MSECPYLKFSESKSCVNCTGYRCVAYGREKKLTDTEQCKTDYGECQRYIDVAGITMVTSNAEPVETLTLNTPFTTSTYISPPVKPLFIKSPCGCGEDIRLSDCPYQSTNIPEGRKSCTGVWCYAKNKNVRVPKNCWNYGICTVYLMSKYKGVPYPEVK